VLSNGENGVVCELPIAELVSAMPKQTNRRKEQRIEAQVGDVYHVEGLCLLAM